MKEVDAIIALAGDYSPQGGIGDSTRARMDGAIRLSRLGVSSRLIVSGGQSFTNIAGNRTPLSQLMAEYAHDNDIPSDIYVEDKSLETVGNAVFTKLNLTEPNSWNRLIVVTNEFHLPRSMRVFGHVMGDGYEIKGVPVSDQAFPHQWSWEHAAGLLSSLVLAHTLPGDSDAVKSRLFNIVPGYRPMSTPRRIFAVTKSLVA